MKAEINNENKARFISLYTPYGEVWRTFDSLGREIKVKASNIYLKLKPLSKISDEDAILAAKNISPFSFATHKKWEIDRLNTSQVGCISTRVYSRKSLHRFDIDEDGHLDIVDEETGAQPVMVIPDFLSAYDFLRSHGYALPYLGLSVEKMVMAGWIKLVDK